MQNAEICVFSPRLYEACPVFHDEGAGKLGFKACPCSIAHAFWYCRGRSASHRKMEFWTGDWWADAPRCWQPSLLADPALRLHLCRESPTKWPSVRPAASYRQTALATTVRSMQLLYSSWCSIAIAERAETCRLHPAAPAGLPHRLLQEHARDPAVHLQVLQQGAAAGCRAPALPQVGPALSDHPCETRLGNFPSSMLVVCHSPIGHCYPQGSDQAAFTRQNVDADSRHCQVPPRQRNSQALKRALQTHVVNSQALPASAGSLGGPWRG